jgi:23S rRNA (cytidine1920-2'-O)/16S rRNA (cytidine1409-2'-O)-methyltransferase
MEGLGQNQETRETSLFLIMTKRRIDHLLVERGCAESRQKAQAIILAGQVLVDEQKVEKPGQMVAPGSAIRVIGRLPFVSRAGVKLRAALDCFQIPVAGRFCADLGASTGGFTDCLLQAGARSVHAFDVGRGQLAWKLRSDPRVVVRDRFNVRDITAHDLPLQISLVTADLSFISLDKILPPLSWALRERSSEWKDRPAAFHVDLVLLVKPQFEVGKGEVGKGGIVRAPEKRLRALAQVESAARGQGYEVVGRIPSPISGARGNQEFLLYLRLFPDL